MDVRKDTSLGDGDSSEELVQFLIVPDGELDVTGSDSGSLVVLRSIARELEELSSQITTLQILDEPSRENFVLRNTREILVDLASTSQHSREKYMISAGWPPSLGCP